MFQYLDIEIKSGKLGLDAIEVLKILMTYLIDQKISAY